jgi:hypothetical protein
MAEFDWDKPAPTAKVTVESVPDWDKPKKEKSFGEKAFEFVEPAAEALGTAGGAALGTPLGPAGVVGGAGLGYAMTREAMRLGKEKLGYVEPRSLGESFKEPAYDVSVGGLMEGAGRGIVAPVIQKTIVAASRGIGALGDYFSGASSKVTAGKMSRQALGQDLFKAREILASSADDISASQALGEIDAATGKPILNSPTIQALLASAEKRDPRFFTNLLGEQDANRLSQLRKIANGTDQTAAKDARAGLKELLNKRLVPILEIELESANIAGKLAPKFASETDRMAQAATNKVQDVRRFSEAIPRAKQMARQDLIERGLPVGAERYTYLGELSKRADEVASQAAEGSLRFGDASRFAQAALQSLEAHGQKPLKTESIISALNKKLNDPSIAGNRDLETALVRVGQDIQKWTTSGGVIDSWALDKIRQNSVNAVARELFKDDIKAQKQFAGTVLESVRPIIIDAMEQAGGTGYRAYLQNYAIGSQKIAQTKMGADALKLYLSSPKGFVDLVENNRPADVEKVFGAGNYNLAKQMSAEAMAKLKMVSSEVKRGENIKEQVTAGTQALTDLANESKSKFRLPSFISAKVTVTNKILDALEGKLNKNVMNELVKASKSGKSLEQLLDSLPTVQRNEVLNRLNDPATFAPARKLVGGAIAGSSKRKLGNPLQTEELGGITNMEPNLR